MTYEEYVKELGYGDLDRHVFTIDAWEDGDEAETPDYCHVLARWSNESVTAHFNVPNTVLGFFDAFDEVGDPAEVRKVWCCSADPADEAYLDTDSEHSIDWPLK